MRRSGLDFLPSLLARLPASLPACRPRASQRADREVPVAQDRVEHPAADPRPVRRGTRYLHLLFASVRGVVGADHGEPACIGQTPASRIMI